MFVRSRATWELARRLRGEGWALRDIAEHLDVSLGRVSEQVRDIGPVHRRTAPDDAPPARRLPLWTTGEVRRCGRCGFVLPIVLFNRHGAGRQWWCRSCFLGYHATRHAAERETRRGRIERARAFVIDHLARHPCADCGECDPVVLELDHVAAKHALVSTLVGRGVPLARIASELEQCEVVCACCHRRRSASRGGSHRTEGRRPPAGSRPTRERNLRHLRATLSRQGCVDCGEADVAVLDFDHRSDKTANVSTLARNECSLARLDAEIARCDVRCANCHRRRTARVGGWYRTRAASV